MKWGKKSYNFDSYTIYNNYDKKLISIKNIMILIIIFVTIGLIVISKIVIDRTQEANAQAVVEQREREEKEQLELKKKQEEEERLRKEEEERIAHEAKMPKLTDVGRANFENIYNSEEKVVYLTFDDGPSNVTHQILDTLKENDIKATFFVLGTSVKTFPETTKRLFDEGHFIANHGYSHIYSSIYSSKEAVLDEYNKCNDAVREALGEPEYNSHLFRFPGGLPGGKYADLKLEAKELLNENGILNIDWNALSGDAEKQNPTPEYLMDRIKTTTEGKNSVVILMHDAEAKKVTADLLPEIISYFKEQGYSFKSFYDVFK